MTCPLGTTCRDPGVGDGADLTFMDPSGAAPPLPDLALSSSAAGAPKVPGAAPLRPSLDVIFLAD